VFSLALGCWAFHRRLVRALVVVVPGDVRRCDGSARGPGARRLAECQFHAGDRRHVTQHRYELRNAGDLAVAAHHRQHRGVMLHRVGRFQRLPDLCLIGVDPVVPVQREQAIARRLRLVSGLVGQPDPCVAMIAQQAILGAHLLGQARAAVFEADEVAIRRAVEEHLALQAQHLVIAAHLLHVVAIARAARRVQVFLVIDAVRKEHHGEDRVRGVLSNREQAWVHRFRSSLPGCRRPGTSSPGSSGSDWRRPRWA